MYYQHAGSCICMSMYAHSFTARLHIEMGPKARNGFLQVDIPRPLLAAQTIFGNQKWSGVGPILAAKSGPLSPGPIFA